MKRSLIGFLWFLGIFVGANGIAGFSIGFQGGLNHQSDETIHNTAEDFAQRWGGVLFLLSAGAAVVGTTTQTLPGTKA